MRALAPAALALALGACATAPPPPEFPPIDFEAEAAPPPPPPPVKKSRKRMKLSEIAARLESAEACSRAVARLAQRSEKAAWGLMRMCIRQSKFTDLAMLLRAPWVTSLQAMPELEQAKLLTHVMAMRGARFDVDLGLLGRVGPPLHELRTIVDHDGGGTQALVVFRGTVLDRELLGSGLTRFTIVETTPVGVLYRDDAERRAHAVFKVRRPKRSLRIGEEFVFLGRAMGVKDDEAELAMIGSYKKGVRGVVPTR